MIVMRESTCRNEQLMPIALDIDVHKHIPASQIGEMTILHRMLLLRGRGQCDVLVLETLLNRTFAGQAVQSLAR